MATESIGKTVHLTNEMADQIIEAIEEVRKNPPPPRTREVRLATPAESKKIAKAIRLEYGYEK